MMTYQEAAQLPRSEKISLVTCEAVKPSKVFSLYSGNTYQKQVNYFVSGVKRDGFHLYKGGDKDGLLPEEYYFDAATKTLYVSVSDDPKKLNLSIVYKFFFSTTPVILPHDLSSGEEVEWLPYVQNIGSIGQQLDEENVGIVLESSSSVDFVNSVYFQEIIDSLIFENQAIEFYSWFNNIPVSEAKKIFSGVIDSKEYSSTKVTFRVKDFVYRLRNKVSLGVFSESDGILKEATIGKPKRRIYGISKQAQTIPIDCTLDGYPLTGSIALTQDSLAIAGTGTQFYKELNQGDELKFLINGEEVKYTVELVISNTTLNLTKEAEQSAVITSVTVSPKTPYRFKNRRWHVAGHKLAYTEAIILDVVNARTFKVDNFVEFSAGDIVRIATPTGFISTAIERISGDLMVLEQNIFPIPITGMVIARFPIKELYYGRDRLVPIRDFDLINDPEAIIELTPEAEFNIAKEERITGKLKFKPGQRLVDTSDNVDLRTIVKPGDWIRSEIQSDSKYYEVHHVDAQVIYIKEPFTSTTSETNDPGLVKVTNNISEDSLILVDCYGKEFENKWANSPAKCVLDLVKYDAGFDNIDLNTFDQAEADCNFTMSLVIPDIGSEAPQIRDVIDKINGSVFGSLYGNSSQEVAFSIVNARRPQSMRTIRDDDIISWEVRTTQKIVNVVKVNYRHFTDKETGEAGASSIIYSSAFVDNNIGIQNTLEKEIYLYNDSDALIIAQRSAFYSSLSQSSVSINGKANFFDSAINDRVYVDLERLYKRYGGNAPLKIGVISAKSVSIYNSSIVMNDLGNIFNRTACVAESSAPEFDNSSEEQKIKFGYIVDSDKLIPGDDEADLGSNLIG